MHDRSAGQPVVEIAEHDDQRVAHRVEILEDLPHLKSPFVDAKTEVGREHMHERAADLDGRRQRPARLAALHRQIDAMHVDDRMPGEQRVAEALRHGLSRRPQRALVADPASSDDRAAGFERDAGRIGELLQRDDVGIQLGDDGGDAIRIVASVGADARVHVVGRDAKGGGGGHSAELRARDGWDRPTARTGESAEACGVPRERRAGRAAPIVISAFEIDGSSSVWRTARRGRQRHDRRGEPDERAGQDTP